MNANELSETEAYAFLACLFPHGLKDAALIAELCPNGWERSPFFACYHPAPEVRYQEFLCVSRNLKNLFSIKRKGAENDQPILPEEPEPTFEQFLTKHPPEKTSVTPESALHEPAELLGLCLWDIFSDNHDVIATDGRIVHLGSFRGSAGMISDFFHQTPPNPPNDEDWWQCMGDGYMEFYMGTHGVGSRADLTPAYELIFRRLQSAGADWRYSFPRIHLIDFDPPEPTPDAPYSPSAAFAQEAKHQARAEETAKMRKQIDRDVLSAKRMARAASPPATVRAFQNIFHRFPAGWPPDPYSPE